MARKFGVNFNEQKDPHIIQMRKKLNELGGIDFKIEQYPDGSWAAESTNVDGIITGGTYIKNIPESIRDATFTYFGVPPYLCVDNLLKANNEPVVLKQHVYV